MIQHPLYLADLQGLAALETPLPALDQHSFFLTGGTGMIGTLLTEALLLRNRERQAGIRVTLISRNKANALTRFGALASDPLLTILEGDINRGIPSEESFDYLLHMASNTHPCAYASDPIGTVTTNIIGTNLLLEYAATHGAKRVMFLSSVEIYGENRGDIERFDERYCGYLDCNTLRAGYPESKRAGEALCQAYVEQCGLDVVIPRLSRVYGPSMLPSDSKASSQFIRHAVAGHDIVLKSVGMQFYSYCYSADAAAALLFLLQKGKAGQAYNVTGLNSDVHLRDLAQLVAHSAGTKVIFDLPDAVEQKGFSKATTAVLDGAKLSQLGWTPQTDLKSGISRTVKILKD